MSLRFDEGLIKWEKNGGECPDHFQSYLSLFYSIHLDDEDFDGDSDGDLDGVIIEDYSDDEG